jgi:DNA-binding NarL/FixJ family response regulator
VDIAAASSLPGFLPPGRNLILIPANELTAATAGSLEDSGVRVIVMAALPRAGEREQFARAGAAAYVTMDIDTEPLLAIVRNILAGSKEGMAASAIPSVKISGTGSPTPAVAPAPGWQ